MKHIVKPAVPEKVRYTCDVTGLPLEQGPCASITIRCEYGAPHDGSEFTLDLSEKAAETVLPLLRALLLDGAPLEPHRTEVFLNEGPLDDKPIARRERAKLLHELDLLHRQRKRSQTRK